MDLHASNRIFGYTGVKIRCVIMRFTCAGCMNFCVGLLVVEWQSFSFVFRLSLNTITLTIDSNNVYTQLGVAISVTGIAQVRTDGWKKLKMLWLKSCSYFACVSVCPLMFLIFTWLFSQYREQIIFSLPLLKWSVRTSDSDSEHHWYVIRL